MALGVQEWLIRANVENSPSFSSEILNALVLTIPKTVLSSPGVMQSLKSKKSFFCSADSS